MGEAQQGVAAAHVNDVARLYRLTLERSGRGVRYHAVAEEGVRMHDMCEVIGRRLDLRSDR